LQVNTIVSRYVYAAGGLGTSESMGGMGSGHCVSVGYAYTKVETLSDLSTDAIFSEEHFIPSTG